MRSILAEEVFSLQLRETERIQISGAVGKPESNSSKIQLLHDHWTNKVKV